MLNIHWIGCNIYLIYLLYGSAGFDIAYWFWLNHQSFWIHCQASDLTDERLSHVHRDKHSLWTLTIMICDFPACSAQSPLLRTPHRRAATGPNWPSCTLRTRPPQTAPLIWAAPECWPLTCWTWWSPSSGWPSSWSPSQTRWRCCGTCSGERHPIMIRTASACTSGDCIMWLSWKGFCFCSSRLQNASLNYWCFCVYPVFSWLYF